VNSVEISVIMSVYNTKSEYLVQAIESILHQTYSSFEFIIVDDKSSDGSLGILRQYKQKDDRIVLIENKKNLGLTKSLNIALGVSKGKYIARMDADDVSLPNRLKEQYEYMERHHEISVVGSQVYTGKNVFLPIPGYNDLNYINLFQMMFWNAGVSHPASMIRRDFLNKHNIKYDETIRNTQDYALWLDIVTNGGLIKCLPVILLIYRIHDSRLSNNKKEQMEESGIVKLRGLNYLIGDHSEIVNPIHSCCMNGKIRGSKRLFEQYLSLLLESPYGNSSIDHYKDQVYSLWLRICFRRLKNNHKIDFFFSKYTLRCFSFGVLRIFYLSYYKPLQKFKRCISAYLKER